MKHNIVIIASLFHEKHVMVMLKEAKEKAGELGLTFSEVLVPGCYEIPLALKRELDKTQVQGAVVLGIIEKGETKHGLVMGFVVHHAIVQLELETGKPVGKAILGPEITPSQIEKRIAPYAKDAVSALDAMLKTTR